MRSQIQNSCACQTKREKAEPLKLNSTETPLLSGSKLAGNAQPQLLKGCDWKVSKFQNMSIVKNHVKNYLTNPFFQIFFRFFFNILRRIQTFRSCCWAQNLDLSHLFSCQRSFLRHGVNTVPAHGEEAKRDQTRIWMPKSQAKPIVQISQSWTSH